MLAHTLEHRSTYLTCPWSRLDWPVTRMVLSAVNCFAVYESPLTNICPSVQLSIDPWCYSFDAPDQDCSSVERCRGGHLVYHERSRFGLNTVADTTLYNHLKQPTTAIERNIGSFSPDTNSSTPSYTPPNIEYPLDPLYSIDLLDSDLYPQSTKLCNSTDYFDRHEGSPLYPVAGKPAFCASTRNLEPIIGSNSSPANDCDPTTQSAV